MAVSERTLDCRKCGSSQTLVTPHGMVDMYNFKVRIQCLTCGYTKYSVIPMPHNGWDDAEQTKNEIEREKDERAN